MRIVDWLWGRPDTHVEEAQAALARAVEDNERLERNWPQVRSARRQAENSDRRTRRIIEENHLSEHVLKALRKAQ